MFPIGRMGVNRPTGDTGYFGDSSGGNHRCTWAWLTSPYIEQSALYQAINFSLPYDHATQTTSGSLTEVPGYLCPSDPRRHDQRLRGRLGVLPRQLHGELGQYPL